MQAASIKLLLRGPRTTAGRCGTPAHSSPSLGLPVLTAKVAAQGQGTELPDSEPDNPGKLSIPFAFNGFTGQSIDF